jgi:hypothetical protein
VIFVAVPDDRPTSRRRLTFVLRNGRGPPPHYRRWGVGSNAADDLWLITGVHVQGPIPYLA